MSMEVYKINLIELINAVELINLMMWKTIPGPWVFIMGILTERERDIMQMLKDGKAVNEIGKHFKVSDTSISRSISNIRTKILDIEDDVDFLVDIGFLEFKNGKLECISRSRDPKALSEMKKG